MYERPNSLDMRGIITHTMKEKPFHRRLNEKFLQLADAVSFGMGTPTNIIFWILAVVVWFALGITQRQLFMHGGFLPDWFTSNAWNFPLNTITTLAELYIGFLVAAATNRSERHLHELIKDIKRTVEEVEKINAHQTDILNRLMRYEKQDLKQESKIVQEVKKTRR